jgi:hypothetical protein
MEKLAGRMCHCDFFELKFTYKPEKKRCKDDLSVSHLGFSMDGTVKWRSWLGGCATVTCWTVVYIKTSKRTDAKTTFLFRILVSLWMVVKWRSWLVGCAILNRTYSYSSSEDSLNESFSMPFPLRNSSKTHFSVAVRLSPIFFFFNHGLF